MGGNIAGIIGRTVDQGGLAPAQELLAHQVEARRVDNPANVADPALMIEDPDLQP
jgi:hypothetical protein